MTLETLTTFFGWCSVINIGVMLLSTILAITLQKPAAWLHGKMFRLDEATLRAAYYQYLAQYKIFTFVLSIVPYAALKLMATG